MPRALGDVVLCPEVVGEEWRGPLVHGLLHLLGYEHGEEMERREREHAADDATGQAVALPELQPRRRGVIHALRTQRNLWIHFALAAAVLVAAVGFGVDRVELMALLLAITFVLVAELVNTAIEAAVDVASTSFDPMAKLAKDIAAGAVLIASLNAVAVGYLVFSGAVADRSSRFLDRLSNQPAELTLVALALTVIIVIAVKAYTGRGTPLRGGLPSGHAVAFAGWMAVTLILDDSSERFLVSSLAFIMALLVAQTRVETGVLRRGGRERRGGRRAHDPLPLPGVRMTTPPVSDRAPRPRRRRRGAGVRSVLASTSAARCWPATGA